MPNNTPRPPQSQAPQMPQQPPMQSPQMSSNEQGKQEINPEKMLLQFLKDIEQKIEELSQRVDVLEQKSGEEPA